MLYQIAVFPAVRHYNAGRQYAPQFAFNFEDAREKMAAKVAEVGAPPLEGLDTLDAYAVTLDPFERKAGDFTCILSATEGGAVFREWGIACGHCGKDSHLDITASISVRLTPHGTDTDESVDGSHEWDQDSECVCTSCGHSGKVHVFTFEKV